MVKDAIPISSRRKASFLTKQMNISISTPTVFISILSSSHQMCYSTLKSAKITTKTKWFDIMKTIPNYMRSRAPYYKHKYSTLLRSCGHSCRKFFMRHSTLNVCQKSNKQRKSEAWIYIYIVITKSAIIRKCTKVYTGMKMFIVSACIDFPCHFFVVAHRDEGERLDFSTTKN